MSITIVSALPSPASSAAADNSANAEDSASSQGFASLLLGQLFPGSSNTALVQSSDSSEPVAGNDNTAEGTPLDDPMALLATLSQIPVEQRNDPSTARLLPPGSVANTGEPALAPTTFLSDNVAQDSVDEVSVPRLRHLDSMADTDKPILAPTVSSTGHVVQESETGLLTGKSNPTPINNPSPLTANGEAAKFAVIPGSGQIETAFSKQSLDPGLAANEPTASVAGLSSNPQHTQAVRETSLNVPTPLRDQNWSHDFSQKIVWLASSHKQSAELTLNPPHMGAIEISLQVDNDKATASFASANASVREAIETALPRLREMLSGVGIELGQANVSAESSRQASGQENGSSNANRARSDNAILPDDSHAALGAGAIVTGRGVGLVDTFA